MAVNDEVSMTRQRLFPYISLVTLVVSCQIKKLDTHPDAITVLSHILWCF